MSQSMAVSCQNRPSSLKIHRDSHQIHKPSAPAPISSTSTTSSSSSSSSDNSQPQRRPVIIYTHSPKVIHTDAKDFMALVQKLTGMSRSDDDEGAGDNNQQVQQPPAPQKQDYNIGRQRVAAAPASVGSDDSSSSSSTSSRIPISKLTPPPPQPPMFFEPILPPSPHLPLFGPSSSDFFCQPGMPLFPHSDQVILRHRPSSSTGVFMKPFQEFRYI